MQVCKFMFWRYQIQTMYKFSAASYAYIDFLNKTDHVARSRNVCTPRLSWQPNTWFNIAGSNKMSLGIRFSAHIIATFGFPWQILVETPNFKFHGNPSRHFSQLREHV